MQSPTIAIPAVVLSVLMPLLDELSDKGMMSNREKAMYLVLKYRMKGEVTV